MIRHKLAFTRTELMVVVATIALLALMVIPAIQNVRTRSSRISCISCLKQVGISFRIFASDHHERFPFFISTNAGGSMEAIPQNTNSQPQSVPLHYLHFLSLSNELGTPLVIRCPADKYVSAITSFSNLNNQACSYFVGTSANEDRPEMILVGDKNMTNYQRPVGITNVSMFITITTNHRDGSAESTLVGFNRKLHAPDGNVALADGSVQQVTATRLQDLLRISEHTQKFSFPESKD